MTVSSTNTKNSYSGDDSTVVFAYTFKVFDDDDIQVILRNDTTGAETVQTKTTHYSVSGVGNTGGGNITFVTAPATGETVVLLRAIPLTQTTDYTPNDPFPAATHEDALDRLTFIVQDQQEELDRAIKISKTNTITSPEFTVGATTRANKIFAFDSSGDLSVTQEIGTYQGTDATTTTSAYSERDIIKSTTAAQLNNVYICVADSVAGDLLTDTDHFELLVDAVSAATSATNAAASAVTAEGHADDAETAQAAAEAAQALAETAETNAETAQAAAEAAQAATETVFDNFDDIYLGAKSSDPSVDNDGDPLVAGALYFNTVSAELRAYSGSTWVAGTASTLTAQNFSGDGSTTAFTLAAAPAGENNTQVYIDGVYQQKNTYSVSGSTLTFSEAPPTGTNNIEVMLISTVAVGTTDASLVTYTSSGTGSVQQNLDDKLQEVVSVKDFGAVGDGVTDDTAAIQAAIDYAKDNGNPAIYIPAAPQNGSIRGYYRCNSALEIYDNTKIIGGGPHASELRFLNNTNAFFTDTGSIASNWHVEGLHIRGVADTSPSATLTKCFAIGPANYFTLRDLYIQRFVDGIEFDALDTGLALGEVHNVSIVNSQFPNTTNGFPRYGINLKGNTKKPQAIRFTDCIVYAELNVAEASFSGDNIETDFELTGIGGLFKTSGVQVYTQASGDTLPTLATEGVDYDLYNTTGTPAALTPGTIADSTITSVEARFGSAPASGTTINIIWNDPTGTRGINIQQGTGNSFVGLLVGGWDTNIYSADGENKFDVPYQQIAQTGIQLAAGANNSIISVQEYPNKNIVNEFSIASGVTSPTIGYGYGREAEAIELTTNYTATTSSDPIDWDGAGTTYIEITADKAAFAYEATADIAFRMEEAAGSRVRARFTLDRSVDDGSTWTVLDTADVDYNIGGATSLDMYQRVHLHATDTTLYQGAYSTLQPIRFRVTADRLNGDTVTVLGSGTYKSVLRIEKKNPA